MIGDEALRAALRTAALEASERERTALALGKRARWLGAADVADLAVLIAGISRWQSDAAMLASALSEGQPRPGFWRRLRLAFRVLAG